uniref:Uncharacterized protein n=1 Tax=Ixodes ricinus TaxID=34613 RepID=A0A6B0UHB1_IXORI
MLRKCVTARVQLASQVLMSISRPSRVWSFPPCWRMAVHCRISETGGLPTLVASCTLSSCSFWVGLSTSAWDRATAANQLLRGSALNRPPHRSCPAVTLVMSAEVGSSV